MKTGIKLFGIFLLSSVALYSYADDDHNWAKKLLDSGDILPLEAILKTTREQHPGQILEIELEQKRSQLVYEIELLSSDGKVLELLVDAKTGRIISTEEED